MYKTFTTAIGNQTCKNLKLDEQSFQFMSRRSSLRIDWRACVSFLFTPYKTYIFDFLRAVDSAPSAAVKNGFWRECVRYRPIKVIVVKVYTVNFLFVTHSAIVPHSPIVPQGSFPKTKIVPHSPIVPPGAVLPPSLHVVFIAYYIIVLLIFLQQQPELVPKIHMNREKANLMRNCQESNIYP